MQQKVIQNFSKIVREAVKEVSQKYIDVAQRQNLNFATDIVMIPTGDGAAVVFPIEGVQGLQLDFALAVLHQCVSSRSDTACEIFASNGWCNCHDFFDLRTGVADGKVIVFKDVNSQYNVAGSTINLASRIMGLADRQQIMFSHDAYKNIIDMTEDVELEKRFAARGAVEVKHDLIIDVVQYVGNGENYLSKELPLSVKIAEKEAVVKATNSIFAKIKKASPTEHLESLEVIEILSGMPLPPGMEALFKQTSSGRLTKDTALKIADVFKVFGSLTDGLTPAVTIDPSDEPGSRQ